MATDTGVPCDFGFGHVFNYILIQLAEKLRLTHLTCW